LILDRANVLAYDRARTNREILRALSAVQGSRFKVQGPEDGSTFRVGDEPSSLSNLEPGTLNLEPPAARRAARQILLPVTQVMDETLYGGRPATAEEYRVCRAACSRLEAVLAS